MAADQTEKSRRGATGSLPASAKRPGSNTGGRAASGTPCVSQAGDMETTDEDVGRYKAHFCRFSACSAVEVCGLRRVGFAVLGQLKRAVAELGVQVKVRVDVPPLQSLTPRANVARSRQQCVHVKQQIDP